MNKHLPKKLCNYCNSLSSEFNRISRERKLLLQSLGEYIAQKQTQEHPAQLVVICTHNSRRSHIGQLWLQIAASWYGVSGVKTFSGGTEATAFNPRAVEALRRAGFELEQAEEGPNPVYRAQIKGDDDAVVELELFSKTYDNSFNPQKDFAAIMVCSEADTNCPLIPGAEQRFSLPFEDPKHFDGSTQEGQKYDESVRKIGRELFFAGFYAASVAKNLSKIPK